MKTSVALNSIFQKTVNEYQMFSAGDTVVAAVSGGPDSVALLHLLWTLKETYPISLAVAHLDHGLRGVESAEDAFFVQDLARGLGLPFYPGQGDVLALKEKEGLSLEEAGRELRYKFLREVAENIGARKVALGHTADDQAEEFLLRLIRGSGTRGLSGMPFVREGIFVRPLLKAGRAEILSYLQANKFSFRTDSSNTDVKILRNRIRHDLLPLLERNFNPRIRQILFQTVSILRDDGALLTDIVEEAWDGVAKSKPGSAGSAIEIDLKPCREMPRPIQMRVFQKGLELSGARLKDVGFRHLEAIHNLAMKDGPYRMLFLPGKVVAERIYDKLSFSRNRMLGETAKDFFYEIHGPGRYLLPEIGRSITFQVREGSDLSDPRGSQRFSCFDYNRIGFPLVLRNFRPGDRFCPDGMAGSQKIKDYFINRKIPRPLRSQIPIIEQDGRLVGIVGWRVDERFKITDKTERMLEVVLD